MSLEGLPLEILHSITSYLTTPEYGNFRLLCKTFEKACFDRWAKEFFMTRQFSFTRFSLQSLVDISNDAALRSYLKRLIISTDHVDLDKSRHLSETNPSIAAHDKKFLQYRNDAQHFVGSGAGRMMLMEAMRQLPNLAALEIRDYYSNFDGGRKRDNTNWKSYGATTFFNETCRHLSFQAWPHGFVEDIFSTVVAAAQVSNVRPKTLACSLRSGLGLGPAFQIPPTEHHSYSRFLESLENMTLHFEMPKGTLYKDGGTAFVRFISLAENIRHLRLNVAATPNNSQFFDLVGRSVRLGNLSRLEIGLANIEEDALVTFLDSFPSVRDITLFRITLLGDTWASFLRGIANSNNLAKLRSLRLALVGQRGMFRRAPAKVKVGFNISNADISSFDDEHILPDYTVLDKFDIKPKLQAAVESIVVYDDDFRRAHKDPDAPDSDAESVSGESDSLGDFDSDDEDASDDDEDFVF